MTSTPDLSTIASKLEDMSDLQRAMLDKQILEWPSHLKGAAGGNPFATLCEHCRGRHLPPRDDLCPHASPTRDYARYRTYIKEQAR